MGAPVDRDEETQARGLKLVLAAALAAVAIALALTLLQSPMSVSASNKVVGSETLIATTTKGASYCQQHEALPARTTAIRLWLDATAGPRVRVVVYSAGRAIAIGTRGSDWIGSSVTVPAKPLARTALDTTICVSFPLRDETVLVQGQAAPATVAAHEGRRPLAGRMWIEYLRPGTRSWWSLATEVARRLGLGRAPTGTWVALAALLLLAGAVVVSSRLLLRELA